jgi:acyl-coenzyme A thioesterase PaaI-like protein
MNKNKEIAAVVFEPEFIAELKTMFEEKIVFNSLLGLKITSLGPEQVVATIAMKHELIGHYAHNRIHGGVISAGLDGMGGLAVMAAIGARHMDEPPLERLKRFAKLSTIDLRID